MEELHQALQPQGRIVFMAGLGRPSKIEHPFFEAAKGASWRRHLASSEAPVLKAACGAEKRQWAQDTPWVARLEAGEVPRFLPLTEHTTKTAITDFVADNRLPTINLVERANFYDLANAVQKPLVMLVLDPKTLPTPTEKLALKPSIEAEGTPGAWMLALARTPKFQKRFVFALLDAAEHSARRWWRPSTG